MESPESPVKKKQKKKSTNSDTSNRKCIIHVRPDISDDVTHFTSNSWEVKVYLFVSPVIKLII